MITQKGTIETLITCNSCGGSSLTCTHTGGMLPTDEVLCVAPETALAESLKCAVGHGYKVLDGGRLVLCPPCAARAGHQPAAAAGGEKP